MSIRIERVAILGRHDDPRVADPMALLVEHLTKAGVRVIASDSMALDLQVRRIDEAELAQQADLIIAIGGDGTLLYASNLIGEADTPLLGINRGRLGFLADVSPDEMLDTVDKVLAGNYVRESRSMLSACLLRAAGERIEATALNDVIVQRRETGRMVDIVASVDGVYVNTHSGDGLIVATPTGSTAYALSCSGPIVDPRVDAVVVVPICPHTLTDRPIVIPGNLSIGVRLLEREDTSAELVVDGHSLSAIEPGDVLTIKPSSRRIQLVHPPDYDYFGILRTKLFWGRDIRKRDKGAE